MALTCVLSRPFADARWRYHWVAKPWSRAMIEVLRVVCGIRYEVRGQENIPEPGARIVVWSKHQSAWETMFFPLCLPQRVGYVYKRSLEKIPFFGWALKSFDMVPINREAGRVAYTDFLRKGREILDGGAWIVLFPEGTRVAPGEHLPYKTGGARFAVTMQADLLPVALTSGQCWGRDSISKTPGTVIVSFGPVIRSQGRRFDEVQQLAQQWVETEMERISEPVRTDAS